MSSRKLLLSPLGLASIAIVWSGFILFTERTRTIEGTWIDLFEGSTFFEGITLAEACGPSFEKAPWFNYSPNEKTPEGKLVAKNRHPYVSHKKYENSGIFISKNGTWPVTAYSMKFVGRKNVHQYFGLSWIFGFGYGHLGGFGSEVEVDRVIAIKPIPHVICDVRPS